MKYEGPKVSDVYWPVSATRHVVLIGLCVAIAFLVFVFAGIHRYPVGQPVPASVYTEPFDPCDPAYKFIQTNYGEPNKPKWQAAPDDWIQKFGNNERTALIHSISELRVVVAAQSKRLMALEDWQKKQPAFDPNHTGDLRSVWMRTDMNGILYLSPKDPNEKAKP